MTKPFHKMGLTYFWALNDQCEMSDLEPQLKAFSEAGTAALCLHPRAGLLLPYGGSDWFDFIRAICARAADYGLDIWLYDEDPYPSGNAGGWITAEHPEFVARQIVMHTYDPKKLDDPTLFCFPTGKLLWTGLIESGPQTTSNYPHHGTSNGHHDRTLDLSDRVGILRRKWETWEHWDSRYFYPETPLYTFPRAETRHPEFALRVPQIPPGMKLVSFVAMPSGEDTTWGNLADTLNPACTAQFIKRTHERYKKSLGDLFGKQIKAIFSDECKFMSPVPWTPGMFEDFQQQHGFDLRPRLADLFTHGPTQDNSSRASLTRLLYRDWCNRRLQAAWFEPVSNWCHDNGLNLVGHVSPEDDLVQQSDCVGNLFPIYKYFDLAGLDLIIPAVGDHRHPIISVGITSATSIAQQRGMKGVMSETGACAGYEGTAENLGRILSWQTVLGMTSPVIHCAYASQRGPRAMEYPPNYGPNSKLWPAMPQVHRQIEKLQSAIWGKSQVAPVAILWPIRSFNVRNIDWLNDTTGMRRDMIALLQACLDRQVGTHILDESQLNADDTCITSGTSAIPGIPGTPGEIHIGLARYSHVLVPSSIVWHSRTMHQLRLCASAGVNVQFVGTPPTLQHSSADTLEPLNLQGFAVRTQAQAVSHLPRIIDFDQDAMDIRATAWFDAATPGIITRLVMNLRQEPWSGSAGDLSLHLAPAEVRVVESIREELKQLEVASVSTL